jgi:hypothetical protein
LGQGAGRSPTAGRRGGYADPSAAAEVPTPRPSPPLPRLLAAAATSTRSRRRTAGPRPLRPRRTRRTRSPGVDQRPQENCGVQQRYADVGPAVPRVRQNAGQKYHRDGCLHEHGEGERGPAEVRGLLLHGRIEHQREDVRIDEVKHQEPIRSKATFACLAIAGVGGLSRSGVSAFFHRWSLLVLQSLYLHCKSRLVWYTYTVSLSRGGAPRWLSGPDLERNPDSL